MQYSYIIYMSYSLQKVGISDVFTDGGGGGWT